MSPDDTCVQSSLAAGEQLIGSAAQAVGWVCLEQAGPWGRDALTQSRLDPAVGAEFAARASDVGLRPCLVRRPGRRTEHRHASHTLLIAHTAPPRPWLMRTTLDDPRQVLDLDFGALAQGRSTAFPDFESVAEPVLLVCTNGRRDACCAVLGRPVALDAEAAHPGRVWEVTHTGGHRFGPTAVTLPSGDLHGRILDAGALVEQIDRGQLPLKTWRGRSTWPAEGQVAELFVRETEQITEIDVLEVRGHGDLWDVRHLDGRRWRVGVDTTVGAAARASCGADPDPRPARRARLIDGPAPH